MSSLTVAAERRALSYDEFELVNQTHHPAVRDLSHEQLADVARRLREQRNRARDISRRRRRAVLGRPDMPHAPPAEESYGIKLKAQVLAGALKRVNSELNRRTQADRRARHVGFMREALKRKRAQVRHHPSPGQTAHEGMQPLPSDTDTVKTDPRETGRVSQFVRDAQAQRDSR